MIETSGRRGFLAFATRINRRAGVRVATEGSEVEFRELLQMQRELDEAVRVAAVGLAARTSWQTVADATGKSREAAWKKWGKK